MSIRKRTLYLLITAIFAVASFSWLNAQPIKVYAANNLPYYYLPWANGAAHTVSQGNNGSFSHTGIAQYAWDFAGDGFVVEAAREGVVVRLQDAYGTGACDVSRQNQANYVVVSSIEVDGTEHDALYLHVATGSVSTRVSKGQSITRGTPLAVSDTSGYLCPDPTPPATCPPTCPAAHLHFMVMQPGNPQGCTWWCQSVASSFLDSDCVNSIPGHQCTNGVPNVNWAVTSSNVFIPHCTTPTLTGQPAAPANANTAVVFTATAAGWGCPIPTFRFWMQPPGGSWGIVQPYGSAASYSWSGDWRASPGPWHIEVDVRDASETWSYDTTANMPYLLNGCSFASLSASPASPGNNLTWITLTGGATCPGTPSYRFWTLPPGGSWGIVQDYSTTNSYSWYAAIGPVGTWGLEVDVRDQGATDSYEKVANLTYVLSVTPCVTPNLGANPIAPGATGGTITFTASTSGCPNPVYKFWILAPGGSWTWVRSYSTSPTFQWGTWTTPSTGLAGSYGVEVDVRDLAETTTYDAVRNITYQLNACSAAFLSASPGSPSARGTSITLLGAATCPGPPTYRFWIRAPGGNWTIVQDYSSSNSYLWNTSGLAAGSYGLEVDVRDQGAAASYEAVANLTYTLT